MVHLHGSQSLLGIVMFLLVIPVQGCYQEYTCIQPGVGWRDTPEEASWYNLVLPFTPQVRTQRRESKAHFFYFSRFRCALQYLSALKFIISCDYFFFFLFLNFTLQYCISFGIHWHESTTGVHELPNMNPPPTPHHPSGSSTCTSPKHPASCILHWTQTGNSFLTW